jgi:serine protease
MRYTLRPALLFLLFLPISGLYSQSIYYPNHIKKGDYVEGQLLVKLKAEFRAQMNNLDAFPKYKQLSQDIEINAVTTLFPSLQWKNSSGRTKNDISLWIEIRYSSNKSIAEVLRLAASTGIMDHVQPRLVAKPMFTPNDPQIGQQYHHALIRSFQAFDIEEGDTNVFIGITDAGIQFDHQDLGNVRYNYADPVNGVDDDNNGYIDDFRGWNTANNTNNPTATLSPHGMFTTGMSSATVNNAIGVAGNAYRCKFVPVRIDDANGFSYGYEGIVYLVSLGCKIINASWGSTFSDPFGAEVIEFARTEGEALIIAAAGNSALNEKYYPAAYEGVMSVAATGASDLAWPETTFNATVDICAPGELVRSCWPFNGYDVSSGTSFSAPLVTGAAALVKSHFPQYTAEQVGERLRVTADTSIYSLGGNSTYQQLLGAGRLNMERALSDALLPSVRFQHYTALTSAGNNFIQAGDTLFLSGTFFNYLESTNALNISISSPNANIEIIDGQHTAGSITTLSGVFANNAFSIRLLEGIPYNTDLLIKVKYTDATLNYSAFEYIEIRVNRDYYDFTNGLLQTTVTSRGSIGYNANYATDGLGIRYNNSPSQIYAAGLMISANAQTFDNVYAATIPGYDNDFVRQDGIRVLHQPGDAFEMVESRFATITPAGQQIAVRQRARMNNGSTACTLEYTLRNIGTTPVNSLSLGIFSDWDIQNSGSNQAQFDAARRLVYAYGTETSDRYFGFKLLNNQNTHAYCFNNDGAGSSITLYDGFSDAEKTAVVSGSQTRNASTVGEVSALLGTAGAPTLEVGDSITLTFVLLADASLQDLQTAADNAQLTYYSNNLNAQWSVAPVDCIGNGGSVSFETALNGYAGYVIRNPAGSPILSDNSLTAGDVAGPLPAGNYTLSFTFPDNLQANYPITIDALPQIVINDFVATPEIALLPNAEILCNVIATGATSFLWNWGDGLQSASTTATQNHTYTEAGIFQIELIATNEFCNDTATATVEIGTSVGVRTTPSQRIQLYPNPAIDAFTIDLPKGVTSVNYTIFDVNGRLLHSGTSTTINCSTWAPGLYMVQINAQNTSYNLPLVISERP